MGQKSNLFKLAERDDYLDSIRGDISPEEYDRMKAAIRDAFAKELANTIPLSLALLKPPEREHFLRLLTAYPLDMELAIDRATLLYKKNLDIKDFDLSFDPNLGDFFDPKKILKGAESLRKKDQSIRSKGKPKKRKALAAKSVTIAAMRKARKEGQTLTQFLASAGARSVEGLEIMAENLRGVTRYAIEADELSKSARVAHSTLEEWFTEAGKQASPD